MIKFIENINSIIDRLSSLPKGQLFSDAKNILTIFKKSTHQAHEVLYKHEQSITKITKVPIDSIEVTQPNIQMNKVIYFIKNPKKITPIPGVRYGNKVIICDGHHRLVASYFLGYKYATIDLATS